MAKAKLSRSHMGSACAVSVHWINECGSMSFVATDPVSHKGKTNTWLTPLSLVNSLGRFDLDPCAHPGHATADKLITLPSDGLSQEWFGRVSLNPPYGKEQQEWLNKMQEHGDGVALIFARLETRWIQPFLNRGFFHHSRSREVLARGFHRSFKRRNRINADPIWKKNVGSIMSSKIEGRWFH